MKCIGWCEFDKYAQKVTEQCITQRSCGLKMMYERCEDGSYQGLLFGHSDSPARMSLLRENKKALNEEHGADYF